MRARCTPSLSRGQSKGLFGTSVLEWQMTVVCLPRCLPLDFLLSGCGTGCNSCCGSCLCELFHAWLTMHMCGVCKAYYSSTVAQWHSTVSTKMMENSPNFQKFWHTIFSHSFSGNSTPPQITWWHFAPRKCPNSPFPHPDLGLSGSFPLRGQREVWAQLQYRPPAHRGGSPARRDQG